jgi:hypothetical protein
VEGTGDGGPVAYTYRPPNASAPTTRVEIHEIVWADLPTRLSELHPAVRAFAGFRLLARTLGLLLLRPGVIWGNKYQFITVSGSLLILFFWYVGVLVVVPAALVEYFALPDVFAAPLKALEGLFGRWRNEAGIFGVQLWAAASALMALLPVSRVVEGA